MPAPDIILDAVLLVIIEFELEVVIRWVFDVNDSAALLLLAVVVAAEVNDSDVPSTDEDDNRLDSLNSGDENEAVSLRLLFNEGDSFVDIIINYFYIYILNSGF